VIGRYPLAHDERLLSLFSFDSKNVYALDAHGHALGWNLESSLPIGPFAGGACLLQPPVAETPSQDALVGLGPTGGFLLCGADGRRFDDVPPASSGLAEAHPTALAVRREGDGHVRYAWGNAEGALVQWKSGDKDVTRTKAAASVLGLSILSNGDVLAITGDGKLIRWNGKSTPPAGVRISAPSCGLDAEPCPTGEVRIAAAVIDPDGAWALLSTATAGFESYGVGDGRTQLFDVTPKGVHQRWELKGTLASSALGLEGGHLLLSVSAGSPPDIDGPYQVELLESSTGRPTQGALKPSSTLAVQFSTDGKILAASFADGSVGLWDVESGKPLAHESLGAGPLESLAFSPDGSTLAVQPQDGPAQLLDGHTAKRRSVLQSLMAKRQSNGQKKSECPTSPLAMTDEGEPGARELAFSPDGTELLTSYGEASCASSDPCEDCPVAYTPARVRVSDGALLEHWENAEQLLFARCSVALGVPVLPAEDGGATAWNAQGKTVGRLGLPSVAVSRCATGGDWVGLLASNAIYLQRKMGGAPKRIGLPGTLSALTLSPDGRLALVASEHEVRLLSLPEGRRLQVLPLEESKDVPRAMAFSPDGKRFVVGTQRGVLLTFPLRTASN
jgi:WD40 repeat protein